MGGKGLRKGGRKNESSKEKGCGREGERVRDVGRSEKSKEKE